MWNLKHPDASSERADLVNTVPGIDDAQLQEVEALYALYRQQQGRPSVDLLGGELPPQLLASILAAYGEVQDDRILGSLRGQIKLLVSQCPYCGFGQIQDLDHHLPKAIYNVFSIFSLNLVPACATCNRHKPRVPRPNRDKHLLNLYLEDLTQFEFLCADVEINHASGALVAQFRIAQSPGMSDELFRRLQNHFEVFRLHERYPAQVNIYLSEQELSIEDAFSAGGSAALRDWLTRSASRCSAKFGFNDWRSALLRGLAACDAFCDGGFSRALGGRVPV